MKCDKRSILRNSLLGPKTCIVLLLLGVVINVLVAWGCVVLGGRYEHQARGEDPVAFAGWWSAHAPGWVKTRPQSVGEWYWLGYSERFITDDAHVVTDYVPLRCVYVRAGLPFVALCCDSWEGADWLGNKVPPKHEAHGALELKDKLWSEFPLLPVWPGFVADSLLYAAMLWAVVSGSLLLRSKRRLKRGLCPVCKYPIGARSDMCSECGSAIVETKKA